MLQEELDMLFLLEHFSLEDLVKAEEEYVNYECTTTVTTREYSTSIDDSWMNLSFESLIFSDIQ